MHFKFYKVLRVIIILQMLSKNISTDECSDKLIRNPTQNDYPLELFDISCSLLDIRFTIIDSEVVKECSRNSFDYENLSEMSVGAVENVEIKNCTVPDSVNFLSIFNRLGITTIGSLSLIHNIQNQDFPYQSEHFKGLNFYEFNLEAQYLKDLPNDFFENIPKIITLNFNYTHLENYSNALATLPNLENLDIKNNPLTQL